MGRHQNNDCILEIYVYSCPFARTLWWIEALDNVAAAGCASCGYVMKKLIHFASRSENNLPREGEYFHARASNVDFHGEFSCQGELGSLPLFELLLFLLFLMLPPPLPSAPPLTETSLQSHRIKPCLPPHVHCNVVSNVESTISQLSEFVRLFLSTLFVYFFKV